MFFLIIILLEQYIQLRILEELDISFLFMRTIRRLVVIYNSLSSNYLIPIALWTHLQSEARDLLLIGKLENLNIIGKGFFRSLKDFLALKGPVWSA